MAPFLNETKIMTTFTFPKTVEADSECDAQVTLFVGGKETKIYIQLGGHNEYCVSVDNLSDPNYQHVRHVSFAHSFKEACKIAIVEFLNNEEKAWFQPLLK